MDKFYFVIKEGKIVEVHVEVGEEKLKAETALDEGASYFGEAALAPYDSPIRNQELLFYNTLFDENAACHLAFGEAYAECIKGGEDMSKDELNAHGLNDSITQVDFMVGLPTCALPAGPMTEEKSLSLRTAISRSEHRHSFDSVSRLPLCVRYRTRPQPLDRHLCPGGGIPFPAFWSTVTAP